MYPPKTREQVFGLSRAATTISYDVRDMILVLFTTVADTRSPDVIFGSDLYIVRCHPPYAPQGNPSR